MSGKSPLRFTGVFFSILSIFKETFLIIFLGLSIFIINWKISSIVLFTFIFFSSIIFIIVKGKLYSLGKDLTFFQSNFLKKLFEAFNNIKFIKIRKLENFITTKLFYLEKKSNEYNFCSKRYCNYSTPCIRGFCGKWIVFNNNFSFTLILHYLLTN